MPILERWREVTHNGLGDDQQQARWRLAGLLSVTIVLIDLVTKAMAYAALDGSAPMLPSNETVGFVLRINEDFARGGFGNALGGTKVTDAGLLAHLVSISGISAMALPFSTPRRSLSGRIVFLVLISVLVIVTAERLEPFITLAYFSRHRTLVRMLGGLLPLWLLVRLTRNRWVFCALVAAWSGSVSNFVGSIALEGRVIDFIYVPGVARLVGIFNLADVAVYLGITGAWLLIFFVFPVLGVLGRWVPGLRRWVLTPISG